MHTRRTRTVAYDRAEASREEVAALLDRLAHHVRAGILVGDRGAIALEDELDVRVIVSEDDRTHEHLVVRLGGMRQ